MKDILFYLAEHKNVVKIIAIIAIIFGLCSVGISTYISLQQQEETKVEEAAKKKKSTKKSKVTLTNKQKKTIKNYDNQTAQFEALLSANVWVTYSGSGRSIYFTDSSMIVADPNTEPRKKETPFVIKALSTSTVNVGEMTGLTRYTCAYESSDEESHVLTVDKNDDGSYFNLSIDLTGSGTPEEYSRTQAASTFEIDGISSEMSEMLGNNEQNIEDYLREQCALFYPNASKAISNGGIEADFNEMTYSLTFNLQNEDSDYISSLTIIYNFKTHKCSTL